MNNHTSKTLGPYRTVDVIGSSDHGVLYEAIHQQTDETVMLRTMYITVRDIETALTQCDAVLAELAKLEIPYAAKILDYGHENNTLYIALPVMRGGSLKQRMQARIPDATGVIRLPTHSEVLTLVERMATALDTLHKQGLVHGQLQPQSILFDSHGKPYLTEIGITRILKVIYRLGATNSFSMSRYSAPELWNGERPSPASDQYALACIVYELLTGKAPYSGNSVLALMQAHANDVAAPPHYIVKSLPKDLGMTFWQAFAKDQTRRFTIVRSFYQELQALLAEFPPQTSDFFTFSLDDTNDPQE